jgi:acyl-CoA synthetase (NDP forming)
MPRARRPEAAGLQALLSPRSIAVIGASEDATRLSGRILPILLQHRYAGKIYPVNPRHQTVNGVAAYPTITAVPGPVEAAAVAVRAALVPDVVAECAAAGVRSAVIFSSGFAEEGEDGRRTEAGLAATARAAGMRVLGPNAEGFFNVHEGIPLSFSPTVDYERGLARLLPGGVAVVSQSGGLGFALANSGQAVGMGASYVVSTGNECDLGTLEVAGYLLEDPHTDVVALLVEGFRPGEQLEPVARQAAGLAKTLVVAKLGRSGPGRAAAAAHTAHDAGNDVDYRADFRRFGVVGVDDQEELLDVCFALSRGRRAAGPRVGILTTSGGAGVWLADACAAQGLTVPELDASLQAQLRPLLPTYGSTRNPVDVTAEVVSRAGVARPLQLLASSPQVDAVVLVSSLAGPQLLQREQAEIRGVLESTTKPLLVYSYTHPGPASVDALIRAGLAWYPSPARAARATCALLPRAASDSRWAGH